MDILDEVQAARADELEERIQEAREAYYNGVAIMSDEEYDGMVDELSEIRSDSPQLAAVGAPAMSEWPKVRHHIPMGSLSKVSSQEMMTAWIRKHSRPDPQDPAQDPQEPLNKLCVTDKLDGISVSVDYEDGKLVRAVARGDGLEGEDITPNVARMKGVRQELDTPMTITLRGEIVILKADFREHFQDDYANTRNGASGIARRYDGKGCKHLTVLFYQIDGLETPDWDYSSRYRQVLYIREVLGMETPSAYLTAFRPGIKSPHDIWVDYQQTIREGLPYDIDGLVVEFDDLGYQEELGFDGLNPVGAVAFKFPPVRRDTSLKQIIVQIGGQGLATPVAILEPVRLLGTRVERASLYNWKYIQRLGIDVGAVVAVVRANDVIPRIAAVVRGTGTTAPVPEKCPECGGLLEFKGEHLICPNLGECPAQAEGRLRNWIGKLNILEVGEALIHKLVQQGLARDVPALYGLSVADLAALDRMGEKSAQTVYGNLRAVVPLPLEKWLGCLAIPLCSVSTIELVVNAGYDTLEKVQAAGLDQFSAIPGIGPVRAQSLYGWLRRHSGFIERLLAAGVGIRPRPKGALTGQSVCFTGTMENKRDLLENLASEAGASVKSGVTRGLTYLVMANPNSMTSKAKKARSYGTKCIGEREFLELVGG